MKTEETLSMVVDADQHIGICSRALVVYVTGMEDDEHSDEEMEMFLPMFEKEMGLGVGERADSPFINLIDSRVVDQGDDVIQRQLSDLYGKGNRSLSIFLARMPTKKEWATLKQRAFAFEKVWEKHGKYSEGLKILNVRLVKTTTTVTEEDVSL